MDTFSEFREVIEVEGQNIPYMNVRKNLQEEDDDPATLIYNTKEIMNLLKKYGIFAIVIDSLTREINRVFDRQIKREEEGNPLYVSEKMIEMSFRVARNYELQLNAVKRMAARKKKDDGQKDYL